MSLLGVAAMAAALLTACGDGDAKPVSSAVGQSCVRTADCASGLSCIANVCYKTAPPVGGQAGGASVPAGPVLGSEGESCTSRRDCTDGLGCFNNRCTSTDTSGEAGAPNVGVTLGSRGETCRVNGDCSTGLACLPGPVMGVGVCDLESYGIKPTGLSCTGECLADSDCYQLPISLHTATIKSCEDVAQAIEANAYDCAAPVPAAKALCFQLATYCGYTAKSMVWSCDKDTNSCVYQAACTVAAGTDAPEGCPSVSRLHSLAGLTCNPDTLTCVGATVVATCTTSAKCEGKQIADGAIGDVCSAGECTCYAGNKQCYRKCARDIDCANGLVCDTKKTHLCVSNGDCETNAECALLHHSLAFQCVAGECAQACKTDHECSNSGLNGSMFNGNVCGVDGFCASVAADCVDGTQCPTLEGGQKPFCVPVAVSDGTAPHSGVTD